VALTAAAAAASSDPARVSVKPPVGSPLATFTVTFNAPTATGREGSTLRGYQVYVSGPADRRCASSITVPIGEVGAGQEARAKLAPPDPYDVWCAGRYAGRVEETKTPVCAFRESCPADTHVQTIGRFSFRVRGDAGTRG
jgi:hypothetical protein